MSLATIAAVTRLARGVGAVLAAGFLVLPPTGLAALVHLARVGHHVCPEHGQLTHDVGHVRGHGVARPNSLSVAAPPVGGHGHGHCLVVSTANPVGSDSPEAAPAGGRITVALSATSLPAHPVISLLQLAPKASPPA